MYSNRAPISSHPSRFHELLEAMKNEYESAMQDFGSYKMQREEFEHKMQLQISELSLLQKNLYELERAHAKIKQQYEDEVVRMRRDFIGSSPMERRTDSVAPPQLPLPPNLTNSASTGLASLESHFSSAPFAKRAKTEDAYPLRNPKLNGTEPANSEVTTPRSNSADGEVESSIPVASKKEGYDWLIVYNPKVTRAINIDLLHSLDHHSVVCCVRFSMDGKYLATGSNHCAQVFEVATGNKLCVLTEEAEKEGDLYIRSVCFSPDGKYLVTGAEDKKIRLWDIEKKELVRCLSGHEQDIYSLDFSNDGKFVVSGSGDHTAKIWNPNTGDCLFTLKAEENSNKESGITSVAISPDSKTIICGSLDQYIRIWDAATGELIEKIEGHKNSVYSVAFSPDGKSFVSGSLDKTLKIWELGEPSTCKHTISGHKDFVLSVAYSPDERWIVSGSKDRSVQFWDCQTSTTQLMLQGHKNSVISVALCPTGAMFATGSGDFRARIWSFNPLTK